MLPDFALPLANNYEIQIIWAFLDKKKIHMHTTEPLFHQLR